MSFHNRELGREREEIEFQAGVLSRRFSEEVANILPQNEIAQAMSFTAASAREVDNVELFWQKFMKIGEEGNKLSNVSRELNIATKAVVKTWKDLQEVLPQNEKESLKRTRFEFPTMYKAGKEHETSKEDESKIARVKRTCQNVCDTLDSHSNLFAIVPTGNEYVQIVTGVLTTIVKATVNHGKIGEGFHKTIKMIGTEMEFCAETLSKLRESSEEDKKAMELIIAKVFLQIFNFLIPYAKWCRSGFHRFSKSLDSNYYVDYVVKPRDEILAETGRLQRHTALQTAQGVSKTNQTLTQVERIVKDISEKLSMRQQISTEITIPEEFLRLLAQYANDHTHYMAEVKLLQDERERLRREPQQFLHAENLWTEDLKPIQHAIADAQKLETKKHTISWSEIEMASRHFEVIVNNGYPLDLLTTPEDMKISPYILHHIQGWLSGSESQLMWLCGPANMSARSQVATASAYVVAVSERLKLPLLAYRFRADEFGIPEPENSTTKRSIQMNRLVLMTQSIIRQLIWILPESIEQNIDLSFERFYDLDGSTESLLDMFNLVEELAALLPSKQVLIFVLDGFELVDNDTVDDTETYLDELLHIIRKVGLEKVIKILLSSDGRCRTLMNEDVVSIEEQIHPTGDIEESHVVEDEFWKLI